MSEDHSTVDENEKACLQNDDLLDDDEEDLEDVGSAADESDGSSHLTASDDETPWISWFVCLRGNDFFCEIDEDFIQDDFNLTGLHSLVPYYDYALDFILDVDIPVDRLTEEQQEIVETAAEVLYGLIHARYILTARGMQRMYDKYQDAGFGRCPRVHCQGQHCLPLGISDMQRSFPVNVYCPRCQELYYPRSTKQAGLDGAYFGTTFAHMYLLTYPELIPRKSHPSATASEETYVPKIYGFRIHKESAYYKLREPESSKEEEDDTESDRDSSDSIEQLSKDEDEAGNTVQNQDVKEIKKRPTKQQNFIKN